MPDVPHEELVALLLDAWDCVVYKTGHTRKQMYRKVILVVFFCVCMWRRPRGHDCEKSARVSAVPVVGRGDTGRVNEQHNAMVVVSTLLCFISKK